MKSLNSKVAIVTGATGSIGSAICHALAAAGCVVVAGFNRSAASAHALIAQLPGSGHCALALPVSDSAALAAAAASVASRYGRADILVNCAGTTRFVEHSDLDSLDDALIDEILATNVRGPFAAVRVFRSLLGASADGLVVNISSTAAASAIGSNVVYCASKAALDNMTKSLGRALAPHIRVLSVSPGLVDTDFVKSMDPAWRDQQSSNTPLGRLAQPAEVADTVLAAASLLTFATGSVLYVDGGRLLGR